MISVSPVAGRKKPNETLSRKSGGAGVQRMTEMMELVRSQRELFSSFALRLAVFGFSLSKRRPEFKMGGVQFERPIRNL